ncbi:hypothetical protein BaRGS_00023075 [Batillaria attramentaria]|uniref:Translation elongation factor EF1B beta/delta subunit guanine nucleotide exchange domain-containing protein n=1 Tax=Batillaria attramentaria TaxID=370345 RepID=A0ABD0KET5_9CAEN
MANPLMQENVWLQQQRYEEAEAFYHAVQLGTVQPGQMGAQGGGSSLKKEIAQTRQQIQNALNQPGGHGGASPQVQKRLDTLEKENKNLKKTTDDLRALIKKLESRVAVLEKGSGVTATPGAARSGAAPVITSIRHLRFLYVQDAAAAALKQKRLEEYKAKKAKKPAVVAKSSVILDVKPWDDETDMKEMERLVRSLQKDGLVWGVSKLVDLAYGIKKLQIICVIEDEKISVEDLREEIEQFEDLVQSVDIAAFNKI